MSPRIDSKMGTVNSVDRALDPEIPTELRSQMYPMSPPLATNPVGWGSSDPDMETELHMMDDSEGQGLDTSRPEDWSPQSTWTQVSSWSEYDYVTGDRAMMIDPEFGPTPEPQVLSDSLDGSDPEELKDGEDRPQQTGLSHQGTDGPDSGESAETEQHQQAAVADDGLTSSIRQIFSRTKSSLRRSIDRTRSSLRLHPLEPETYRHSEQRTRKPSTALLVIDALLHQLEQDRLRLQHQLQFELYGRPVQQLKARQQLREELKQRLARRRKQQPTDQPPTKRARHRQQRALEIPRTAQPHHYYSLPLVPLPTAPTPEPTCGAKVFDPETLDRALREQA